MTNLRSSVAVLGLLVGLVAVPTAPAQATIGGAYAAAAFKATNKQRTQRDLRTLRQSNCLQQFATRQAKKLARDQDWKLPHQSLPAIKDACHLSEAGENLAFGFPTGRSVVNRGWMPSAGHRANILSTRFRLMAIGAQKGNDGLWYVSQVFGRKS